MIQDNEMFNVVLGFAVLIFLFIQFRSLQRLPRRAILLSSYVVLLTGWVATVFEGMFWPNVLNIAEHACYALSSLLFSLWCLVALRRSGNRKTS